MNRRTMTRRILGLALTVAMITPALASAAEAAVATWLAPPPGAKVTGRSVEVSVGYNTQSSLEVTRLELWVDGTFNAAKQLVRPETRGVCSFWWNTARVTRGPHYLVVKIFAGDELISKISGTGTVGDGLYDTRPPVVSFANIRTGDVLKGLAKIDLNARDDSGESPLVSLLVDKSLKLLKNTPPYHYDLDTTGYKDGSHELETYAYDGAGNKSDPAIVKVAFKNGMERPVVAAVTVRPSEDAPAPEKDAEIIRSLPPVAPAESRSSEPSQPARAAEPGARATASGHIAAPIARSAAVAKPHGSGHAVQPASVRPISPVNPSVKPQARAETPKPSAGLAPVRPAEPPKPLAPPVSSEIKLMAMAPSAQIRAESRRPETEGCSAAVEEVASAPVSSLGAGAAPSVPPAAIRMLEAGAASQQPCAPAAPGPVAAKARPPVPVRVAMAPDIREQSGRSASHQAIACPPAIKKDARAKLEKVFIPASGKVKLRDLIAKLGGVVFWDAQTKTVIAYAPSLKLVFQIGSDVAQVNGRRMRIDAPYIADGRTIIDAGVYHQALLLVGDSASRKTG